MRKLWAVKIERTIMVMAESEDDAEDLARRHEREETQNDPDFISANLVTGLPMLPEVWWSCIPYGSDDDKSCLHVFSSPPTSKPESQ